LFFYHMLYFWWNSFLKFGVQKFGQIMGQFSLNSDRNRQLFFKIFKLWTTKKLLCSLFLNKAVIKVCKVLNKYFGPHVFSRFCHIFCYCALPGCPKGGCSIPPPPRYIIEYMSRIKGTRYLWGRFFYKSFYTLLFTMQ
jgi:hypothetical protein